MQIGTSTYQFSKRHITLLAIFLAVGLFHNFIANDNPIICKNDSGWHWMERVDDCSFVIPALIPYSAQKIDGRNRNVGPFDQQDVPSLYYRHWLGTDPIGRDVLAGMIRGTSIALFVGSISSVLALLIGIFFAYWSGYVGDRSFGLHPVFFYSLWVIIPVAIFYILYATLITKWVILILLLILVYTMKNLSDKFGPARQRRHIPFDIIIFRVIEIFKSVPGLFLILVLLAVFRAPGYWNVVLIIALLRWPVITRHLRAEILNIKSENYIQFAKSNGLSDWKIFSKYVLPITISPIIILTAFGFSAAVLLESTLSFLGIGVPLEEVSWGSLLREARHHFDSWWLAVFPGIMIYFTIYLFNALGDQVNERLIQTDQ